MAKSSLADKVKSSSPNQYRAFYLESTKVIWSKEEERE
jgi:hypothetical protein